MKLIDKLLAQLRKKIRVDETSDEARKVAEQQLRYLGKDLRRRQRDRNRLVAQAHRRGYTGGG